MTYVVTDNCIACKYTDCVEVCPVDCFYEGENTLVIHPDECIDCGVCEPECPAEAIRADTDPDMEQWVEFNRKYAELWPVITMRRDPLDGADDMDGRPDKLATLFSPAPGSGAQVIGPLRPVHPVLKVLSYGTSSLAFDLRMAARGLLRPGRRAEYHGLAGNRRRLCPVGLSRRVPLSDRCARMDGRAAHRLAPDPPDRQPAGRGDHGRGHRDRAACRRGLACGSSGHRAGADAGQCKAVGAGPAAGRAHPIAAPAPRAPAGRQ